MTEEIKDRIELINRGEVPEGYVRTRAGTMPKDWEKTKTASDVFKNYSDKKHNGQGEVLSATQDRGIVPRSEVDIDIKYAEDSVSSYKKVENGDFVISLRSFQGGIEYSQYNGLVSPAYTVLKPILPIEVGYYKAYFKTTDFINRLNSAVYGIRDGKQIGFSDFGDMILHYPSIPEQQKIAEILTSYDKLISLKKEVIAEKQKLKKSCLSKMFPKDGSNVPEVRFPGFSGDWEQRELGEVIEVNSGCDYKHLESGDIPVYGTGGYMLSVDEALSYKMDAIGIGRKGTIDKPYLLYAPFWTVDTLFYAIPKENNNLHFVFSIFQKINWKQKDESTGVPSLSKVTINSTEIKSTSLAEQTAIGTFFKTLDNLINLHQRELEEMEKQKKALMQLLLTGIVRVN